MNDQNQGQNQGQPPAAPVQAPPVQPAPPQSQPAPPPPAVPLVPPPLPRAAPLANHSLWPLAAMTTSWTGQILHTPSSITKQHHHWTQLKSSMDNPTRFIYSWLMSRIEHNNSIGNPS